MSLRLPDSGAATDAEGRRFAPSAARNAGPILEVLKRELPARGRLLELASGTGQHAAEFAAALPDIDWQATDGDAGNLASIRAWGPKLRPPVVLDAARKGWGKAWAGQDAVLVVNLLHLIPQAAAEIVLREMAAALAPSGVALVYGPFLREGRATSDGDAAFDASLRAQDPAIGYKDRDWVVGVMRDCGLGVVWQEMPANNLMLVARRG